MPIDAVAMYSAIKFPLVKKSISYFTRKLPKNQQSTIELFLKIRSTILAFEKIFSVW